MSINYASYEGTCIAFLVRVEWPLHKPFCSVLFLDLYDSLVLNMLDESIMFVVLKVMKFNLQIVSNFLVVNEQVFSVSIRYEHS
jgi:hypothetical protein